MAEAPDNLPPLPGEDPDADGPLAPPQAAPAPPWSQVWQLPALLLGLVLFVAGLYLMWPRREATNYPREFAGIEQFIKAGSFTEAQTKLEALGQRLDRAPKEQQSAFWLLQGDLIHFQQRASKWDLPENHRRLLDAYERARAQGAALDEAHLQRLAEALLALNREAEALALLDELPGPATQRRREILKLVLAKQARAAGAAGHEPARLAPLLSRFLEELDKEPDAARRRAEQIWATGLQAQLQLDAGDPDAVIRNLSRQLILLGPGGSQDLGPLVLVLAKAYQRTGDHAQAQRYYEALQKSLPAADPLNAEVLVGLGQLALDPARPDAPADVPAALMHFTAAETNYPGTPAHLDAIIGRGTCEARLGHHPEAIEQHFRRAVRVVMENPKSHPGKAEQLAKVIGAEQAACGERHDYATALEYLGLLRALYPGEPPAQLVLETAQTHEALALALRSQAPPAGSSPSTTQPAPAEPAGAPGDHGAAGTAGTHGTPGIPATAPAAAPGTQPATAPATNAPAEPKAMTLRRSLLREAATHFEQAGDQYVAHARAVAGKEPQAAGDSLWKAAPCYEQAELWDKAIDVYVEFTKTRQGDPRLLLAYQRLALARQAKGEFAAAAAIFKQVIDEDGRSPEALASLVPLARCYLADHKLDEAKRVLLHVVTDHPTLTPQSAEYREALVELGKLHYHQKEFEPAIARLAEAVERYGATPQAPVLRFLLADAYRQSIAPLNQAIKEQTGPTKRQQLQAERARRLEQGQILFSQVISALDSHDAGQWSPLEQLYYRNAWFYRADCAYDLGRYDEAIGLYDLAAKKWDSHPASLIAMVQIVNAYCALGREHEAKVANDRARMQLKRIPAKEFEDATLPMSKTMWEDWLRWTSEMKLFEPRASAGEGR